MTRIPRDLIRHLEWSPHTQKNVVQPKVEAQKVIVPAPVSSDSFTIDDLLEHGKEFYSSKSDRKGRIIGLAVALEKATEYAGTDGVIASMPYFVAAKSSADTTHKFWKQWYSVQTEELVGIDKEGIHGKKGTAVVLTIHGGGVLTHERIMKAYSEELTESSGAKLSNEEFDSALLGKFPDSPDIPIYTVERVEAGFISNPFGRYGVVIPFTLAKNKTSGQLKKKAFMENPHVLARVGTPKYLEAFFEKAKDSDGVGNYHRLNEMNPENPEGRLLYVYNTNYGLNGNLDLSNYGRFVGVAPEARRARK